MHSMHRCAPAVLIHLMFNGNDSSLQRLARPRHQHQFSVVPAQFGNDSILHTPITEGGTFTQEQRRCVCAASLATGKRAAHAGCSWPVSAGGLLLLEEPGAVSDAAWYASVNFVLGALTSLLETSDGKV
jgi:hypothetical protein